MYVILILLKKGEEKKVAEQQNKQKLFLDVRNTKAAILPFFPLWLEPEARWVDKVSFEAEIWDSYLEKSCLPIFQGPSLI